MMWLHSSSIRTIDMHLLKSRISQLILMSILALATDAKALGNKKTSGETPTKAPIEKVNDFPTQARVEYVMQCMAEHGGTHLDNMYHCVCAIDRIADQMSFQDYSESLTYTYMFDTPGDKGGEFRDPPRSKELRDRLKAAKKATENCFPSPPGAPKRGQ